MIDFSKSPIFWFFCILAFCFFVLFFCIKHIEGQEKKTEKKKKQDTGEFNCLRYVDNSVTVTYGNFVYAGNLAVHIHVGSHEIMDRQEKEISANDVLLLS